MSPRNLAALFSVTVMLGGCSILRPATGSPQVSAGYRPVAKAAVWPAPAGNPMNCTPSGPGGDSPTPRKPATDSLVVRNKALRQVLATLCSFSIPATTTNNGTTRAPLQ